MAAGLQADPYVVRRVVHLAHGCEAAVELGALAVQFVDALLQIPCCSCQRRQPLAGRAVGFVQF